MPATVTPETARQVALYQDTVNVYLPVTMQVGSDKRVTAAAAGNVSPTPDYEGQVGKYYPSSEYNSSNLPMGRTLQDNMLTLDRFHFPLGVELVDGAVIELTTEGHPDEGTFYRLQGASETWKGSSVRQSRYSRVFCKRIPPPAEITQGTVPATATRQIEDLYDVFGSLNVLGVLDVV